MYHALHKPGLVQSYIVQDVGIPWSSAPASLDYLDTSFTHLPLWLCPLGRMGLVLQAAGTVISSDTGEMWINFGVWVPGPRKTSDFVATHRALEACVREVGGRKWLYAYAYYAESKFRDIYDRREYDAWRTKYHAGRLPSIFDEVSVDLLGDERRGRETWAGCVRAMMWSVWPLSGGYGVLSALTGRDYLLGGRGEVCRPKSRMRKSRKIPRASSSGRRRTTEKQATKHNNTAGKRLS